PTPPPDQSIIPSPLPPPPLSSLFPYTTLFRSSASGSSSPTSPCAAPRRDLLATGRLPPERILCCLRRVFPEFALTVILALPSQIVQHGRRCLASAPAPLPDTNTCELLCCDQGRLITPACVW